MPSSTSQPVRFDRWIDRCWRRLRVGQFLKTAADWLAIYLFVFGTIVLAVKLFGQSLWPHVLWLTAGVIPVLVGAWWRTQLEAFTRTESIAILDRRLGAGGLLMTLTEAPDADWQRHLPTFEQLWRNSLPMLWPVRFVQHVALPVMFAIGVCFVPEREIEAAAPLKNVGGQQVSSQLDELLEEVKEAELVREEEEQQLRSEIAQLHEDTNKAPLTHEKWETVDALRAKLQARIDETAAKMSQARDAVAAMVAAMEAQSGEALTPEQRQKLEEEVVETLKKLSKDSPNGKVPGANSKLNDKLKRLTKDGQLPQDPSERDSLMNDLKEFLDQENDRLSDLRSKCKQCGQCQGDKSGEGGQCESGRPGQGGITRGRGDAEMTWGKEADLEGIKFKETVLPPGQADKPRNETIGVSATAPEVQPADSAPKSAARATTTETGSETWNRQVRPRHRPVLKQYFGDKPSSK